jgi:multiple sugar transport system substrate-binding protein
MTARSRLSVAGLIVLSLFTLTGFGCRRSTGPKEQISQSLVVWGLWQESAQMQPILEAFQKQTGVKVEYKKIASVATYEKTLLEALAQGRGPDIFVIHHTWVEGKRGLLSPAPAEVIDERAVKDEFVDVVPQDMIRDGLVYALPTSVDTLALYYNKDVLNTAGVARPPRTWEDLQQAVQKVTKVSRLGIIEQSAVAVGTAANINRSSDILELLILQSGLPIFDSSHSQVQIANDIGERALTFYTDFANKSKKVYTWDLQQDFSLDAFSEGKTAMMFNYAYNLPTIQAKNSRLNFGIAPMPQITDSKTTVNFANYWPFAVSTSSKAPATSWQFIRFLTSAAQAAQLNQAQKLPPARKDSIDTNTRDPLLGVFAEQALTAASWPRVDVVAGDAIVNKMIDDVVTGATTPTEALRRAEDQLNQLKQNNG